MKIVMKFGGTSVADTDKIRNVAKIIKKQSMRNDVLAVIVSAMGKTTNKLTELAHTLTKNPNPRELDALLSVGENMSVALLAMALIDMGLPANSYNAWQFGIKTNTNFGDAEIKSINMPTHMAYLPIVTGFQGISEDNDITTLGREGSDTSAVAIAAALGADVCDIYTDVDGVYDKDPNAYKDAKKLDFITYDDMLKLAQSGAKVLHLRSITTAKKYNMPIRVRGTFTPNDMGTLVAAQRSR